MTSYSRKWGREYCVQLHCERRTGCFLFKGKKVSYLAFDMLHYLRLSFTAFERCRLIILDYGDMVITSIMFLGKPLLFLEIWFLKPWKDIFRNFKADIFPYLIGRMTTLRELFARQGIREPPCLAAATCKELCIQWRN